MRDGIQGVRRIEAVDVDGSHAGLLIGWTSDGSVAIGITNGEDRLTALLDGEAIGEAFRNLREATLEAHQRGGL